MARRPRSGDNGPMARNLWLTGDPAADELLSTDPFALLIGMLLDQQVQMEIAFAGPKKISERMDGFDVQRIATADPDEFASLSSTPPAIHRYPGSMAGRVQAVAQALVADYERRRDAVVDGPGPSGARGWRDWCSSGSRPCRGSGSRRPGSSSRCSASSTTCKPAGWREAAGAYGEDGSRRSIADVVDQHSLDQVRETKKAVKAAAKAAKG